MKIRAGDLYSLEQRLAREHILFDPAHYSLCCRNLLVSLLGQHKEKTDYLEYERNRKMRLDLSYLMSQADAYAEEIDRVLAYAHKMGTQVLYVDEFALVGKQTTRAYLQSGSSLKDALQKALLPQSELGHVTLTLLHLRVRKLVSEKAYTHARCFSPSCFDSTEPGEILVDWVHLNPEGNRLLGEFVASKILALQSGNVNPEERP
jgi:hypothetical protein